METRPAVAHRIPRGQTSPLPAPSVTGSTRRRINRNSRMAALASFADRRALGSNPPRALRCSDGDEWCVPA